MTRFRRGHIHAAKLNPVQVLQLRRLYAEAGWSQGRLARHFGLSVGQVGRIVRGESWQQYHQPVHDDQIEHEAAEAILNSPPPTQEELSASLEKFKKLLNQPPEPERPPPMTHEEHAEAMRKLAEKLRQRQAGKTEDDPPKGDSQ